MIAEKGKTDPRVSIIIVTFNCEDWVARCLSSLPAALGSISAEVFVVDNASSDGSADTVARLAPDIALLRNDVNVGFAAAVNQAAAASTAEWVLLINPDTEAAPGSLSNLLTFAWTHPGLGVYGGRTLRRDGTVEPSSCWDLPTLWSTACFAMGLSTAFPGNRYFDPESMGHWQRDTVREVGMVTGCLLLSPRSVWDELGGLDETFFVYGEDADYSARARLKGYRPTITPDATIVHAIGVSSADPGAKTSLLLAGKVTYARRHLPVAPSLALLRAGVGVRAAGSRLTGRGTKWLSAWRCRNDWWNGFVERGTPQSNARIFPNSHP